MPNEPKMINVEIWNILSSRTKEGKINVSKDKEMVFQFDIREAKRIHKMLGEAIEAAISDTFVYKFLTETVKLSDEKASMALLDFRELRQGSRGVVYQGDEDQGN